MGTQESATTFELYMTADRIRRDVMEVAIRNGRGTLPQPVLRGHPGGPVLWRDARRRPVHTIKGARRLRVYAILADKGILPRDRWSGSISLGVWSECQNTEYLPDAVAWDTACPWPPGSPFPSISGRSGRVFCLIGDGEMQEGSNWEAVQFIVHHRLPVILIVDENGLQA